MDSLRRRSHLLLSAEARSGELAPGFGQGLRVPSRRRAAETAGLRQQGHAPRCCPCNCEADLGADRDRGPGLAVPCKPWSIPGLFDGCLFFTNPKSPIALGEAMTQASFTRCEDHRFSWTNLAYLGRRWQEILNSSSADRWLANRSAEEMEGSPGQVVAKCSGPSFIWLVPIGLKGLISVKIRLYFKVKKRKVWLQAGHLPSFMSVYLLTSGIIWQGLMRSLLVPSCMGLLHEARELESPYLLGCKPGTANYDRSRVLKEGPVKSNQSAFQTGSAERRKRQSRIIAWHLGFFLLPSRRQQVSHSRRNLFSPRCSGAPWRRRHESSALVGVGLPPLRRPGFQSRDTEAAQGHLQGGRFQADGWFPSGAVRSLA